MKTTLDGIEIKTIARWGRNGKYYHWDSPSQKKLDELVKKYGIEQINNTTLWLIS